MGTTMALLATAAACLGLQACGGHTPSQSVAPPQVNVARVVERQSTNYVQMTGVVAPDQQVEIRSRTSGLVTSRPFKGGDNVSAGQLLFSIDKTAYLNDVLNARATLAQAQAALAQSQGDVKRYTALLPDNAIPRQTYDQAVSVTAQNQAVVQARDAALRQARLNLSQTEIRSPISGQIDQPKVDVGSIVSAGDTILDVVSTLDPVMVQFSLPEADYVRYARAYGLQPDQNRGVPLSLILPDGSRYPTAGRVDAISRTIADTGTLTIRGLFENANHLLRPGLTVRVELPVAAPSVTVQIPQRAVGDLLGRKYVNVVGAGNIVEQRFVTLGPTIGDQQVVASGLKPGELIVVDGLQSAEPGKPVAPTSLPSASAPPAGA
jgi:membrane fusion protein (multidrug efflux system)